MKIKIYGYEKNRLYMVDESCFKKLDILMYKICEDIQQENYTDKIVKIKEMILLAKDNINLVIKETDVRKDNKILYKEVNTPDLNVIISNKIDGYEVIDNNYITTNNTYEYYIDLAIKETDNLKYTKEKFYKDISCYSKRIKEIEEIIKNSKEKKEEYLDDICLFY